MKRYCAGCHSDRAKAGNLSLSSFDIAKAGPEADVAERMIRKLQASMMPPPGMPRPEPAVYQAFIHSLENTVDAYAKANPNPGSRTFPRLNRAEYARAIKDLLEIDVNAASWLPQDTMSANFDNIADEQSLSPTLLDAYLNAAGDISRMAVGDKNAPSIDKTYTNQTYVSQHPWDHVEGAPYGTRGGMVVDHVFPADGEYVLEVTFTNGDNARFEDVDISVDGQRVALLAFENGPQIAADGSGASPLFTDPILIKAGQHKVAAAFVRRADGPYEDLIKPHEWSNAGGGSGGGGITTLPQLRDVVIRGPSKTTGISMTPSRKKIFSCRPTSSADERACARQIVTRLGGEAYRRPLTAAEIDRLMPFFDGEAAKNGFEAGVRASLEAILASPYFIFRLEKAPTDARSGGTYRVADIDLASRLSFFLWGEPPDQELIAAAGRKELSTAAGLEKQARRMLADPKSSAISERFAAQWLRLQDVEKVRPDPNFYPNFDENIAEAMRTETKMFFDSLVQEDRSLLDLYRADYTFVNERLAKHYGIAGVQRPRVPPRHLSGRDAPRHLRPRHDAGAELAGQSHVSRAAWQVGDGSAARHAAAAAAAERPRSRGLGRLEGRAFADDPRAHGGASQEPDLQFVPQVHGSDRPRARQLRRHRAVADPRKRHAARYQRRPLRRHEDQLAGAIERRADEAAGAAGPHLYRKPDGVRARTPRRVLRSADGSGDREGG